MNLRSLFEKEATVWVEVSTHPQAAGHQFLRGSFRDALLPRAGRTGDEPPSSRGSSAISGSPMRSSQGWSRFRSWPCATRLVRRFPGTSTSGTGFCRSSHRPSAAARKGEPKPEAVLKWANTPIAMLGWTVGGTTTRMGRAEPDDPRPPVFILVCKNTKIAKVVYEWLGENKPPPGIPSPDIAGFRNVDGRVNTIRVDSKVVHETDTGRQRVTRHAWMRLTLDTVGKADWPRDRQGRPIYPEGFEELALKARASAASARARHPLHRQRRHAYRGLGLQHRHAHRRPAALHVAALV